MPDVMERMDRLRQLLGMCAPSLQEWTADVVSGSKQVNDILPDHCVSWAKLTEAWTKAWDWRQELDDVLSIMCAVAASTLQSGDQLFLQLIGDASCGKTTLCKGLLVSKSCHPFRNITGLHSGFKKKDEPDTDCSLIVRIDKHTLVTPEGDLFMSNGNFDVIMSQMRGIFDGESGASYKNTDKDTEYVGLRTPWIMAGTPALLDKNQSRLGDRFLRAFIHPPTEEEVERSILRRAFRTSLREVRQPSNCDPSTTVDPLLLRALRMTGGYVDWLKANVTKRLEQLTVDEGPTFDCCESFARFTASMRSRPNMDHRKLEQHDTKEMPTRLLKQYSRLATCLAVVLNKDTVDGDVMRRVQKVAVDTSSGIVKNACEKLAAEPDGVTAEVVAGCVNLGEDKAKTLLGFMRTVGIAEPFDHRRAVGFRGEQRWRLTARMAKTWQEVVG